MSILDQIRPCDMDRPYVFISYSSPDNELVWQDVLTFQNMGYNVWLDERNLDKTKASWKDDALAAIEDYCCALVVFYISSHSLTSEACYNELKHTTAEETVAFHNGVVKYIAVETEPIGDIESFRDQVYSRLISGDIPKAEKQLRTRILHNFVRDFFKTNNEKVRIHAKNDPERKMDYLADVTASFPDITRADPDSPAPQTTVLPKTETPAEPAAAPEDPSLKTTAQPQTNSEPTVHSHCDLEIDGTNQDAEKEFLSFYTEAGKKDVAAMYEVGKCYECGRGVEKNPTEAYRWYKKAASNGHVDAIYAVGKCYNNGTGVRMNLHRALQWTKKAANLGHAEAMYELGVHYYYEYDLLDHESTAFFWFFHAAQQGHAAAMCMTAQCYEDGKGIEQNTEKALLWYRKAAELDSAEAMYKLGQCYKNGCGIEKNPDKALIWFEKAADRGHREAVFSIGLMYYNGDIENGAQRVDALTKARDCFQEYMKKGGRIPDDIYMNLFFPE